MNETSSIIQDWMIIGRYSNDSTPQETDLSVVELTADPSRRAASLKPYACLSQAHDVSGLPFESPTYLCFACPPAFPCALLLLASEAASGEGRVGALRLTLDPERASFSLAELAAAPSGGVHPCHVATDPRRAALLCCNYAADDSGGALSAFSLSCSPPSSLSQLAPLGVLRPAAPAPDPSLGEAFRAPHLHMALPYDDALAFVADLGSSAIYAATRAEDGAWSIAHRYALPAGSGPRHLAFAAGRSLLLCCTEWSCEVLVFGVGEDRALRLLSAAPTRDAAEDDMAVPNYVAAIRVVDRFVYVSNRGLDTIAALELVEGRLVRLQSVSTGGKWPRDFAVHPSGRFLVVANQRTSDVHLIWRDPDTGLLTPSGTTLSIPSPASILFYTN